MSEEMTEFDFKKLEWATEARRLAEALAVPIGGQVLEQTGSWGEAVIDVQSDGRSARVEICCDARRGGRWWTVHVDTRLNDHLQAGGAEVSLDHPIKRVLDDGGIWVKVLADSFEVYPNEERERMTTLLDALPNDLFRLMTASPSIRTVSFGTTSVEFGAVRFSAHDIDAGVVLDRIRRCRDLVRQLEDS